MARCSENLARIPSGLGFLMIPIICSLCGSAYPTAYKVIKDQPEALPVRNTVPIFGLCEECAIERLPKLIVEALSGRLSYEADNLGICKQVSKALDRACCEVRDDIGA